MQLCNASAQCPSCRVTLVYGNITGARTELLVNSANGYMKHGGGVAAAIIRAAGAGVADECKALRDVSFGGRSLALLVPYGLPSCDVG